MNTEITRGSKRDGGRGNLVAHAILESFERRQTLCPRPVIVLQAGHIRHVDGGTVAGHLQVGEAEERTSEKREKRRERERGNEITKRARGKRGDDQKVWA